jgi:hypothetical protein
MDMANIMKRSPIQWFLTLAGLSGIAAIFLPFTFDVSPWVAITHEEAWGVGAILLLPMLGAPFLLSVFTGVLTIRWNISGSISLPERTFSYFVSIFSACVTMALYLNMNLPKSIHELFILTAPILIFITGGFLIIRNYRSGKFRDFSPIMAMQTSYLANCVLCLIGFFWQIGAYFALASAVAYAVQMVWIVRCTKEQKLNG